MHRHIFQTILLLYFIFCKLHLYEYFFQIFYHWILFLIKYQEYFFQHFVELLVLISIVQKTSFILTFGSHQYSAEKVAIIFTHLKHSAVIECRHSWIPFPIDFPRMLSAKRLQAVIDKTGYVIF